MTKNTWFMPSLLATSIALTACGSDSDDPTTSGGGEKSAAAPLCSVDTVNVKNIAGENISVPTAYAFQSSLEADTCGVSYTGQTARNTMILDVKSAISSSELLNSAASLADLETAFGTLTSLDDINHGITSADGLTVVPGPTYGDISGSKNLVGKIAGNDNCLGVNAQLIGQNDDSINASIATAFIDSEVEGKCTLSDTSKGHAQLLVEHYFTQIADKITGDVDTVTTSAGVEELPVYVDAEGRDYQQLTQKVLTVAIAFNQGTNDYLVGALTAAHTADKGTKPYTTAEHKWDEGFGYFGAARDYADYTDLQIKNAEVIDTNADGFADLRSEINMNHSSNCAKRDYAMRDADLADQTEFTTEVFEAFVEGRAILAHLAEQKQTLSDEDFTTLENTLAPALATRAKTAANTWEKCIAATVVHYINDSIADIDTAVGNSNEFEDVAAFTTYAKHWSELKGFALGLQYNPNSPIYDVSQFKSIAVVLSNKEQYTAAMELIGDQPDLGNDLPQYKLDLESAKTKLQAIYGFTDNQVLNW